MEEGLKTAAEKIILVGGSAGSLDPLFSILELVSLPPYLAVIIILHRKAEQQSNMLAALLKSKTIHQVREAEEKELITGGCMYIAPGDYHLLIEKDKTLSLDSSEKIHHSRPSIDASFETAAEAYGKNAIGIILSGANQDGTKGLKAIKKSGGTTIVQLPSTATVSYMPEYAIKAASPALILTAPEIAGYINQV